MAPQGCWKDAGGAAQAKRLEALNLRVAGTMSAIAHKALHRQELQMGLADH
jgi:hypothetical protein